MAIIEWKQLGFAYEGVQVLEDVNFSLNAGDYLCVVGENGSGKSTLIKGLLGLKAPDTGSVVYGDGLKKTEIGYLPQQTQIQKDFPASVYEVVLSGCLNSLGGRLRYSRAERERAMENIERMGIANAIVTNESPSSNNFLSIIFQNCTVLNSMLWVSLSLM